MALFCVCQATANHECSRAALVYAIIEGMKIDVGLVIQHSIIHGFDQGIQGFLHPHLITEMCKNAGVKWN